MSKARSLADLISGGATIEASEIADSTITGGKLASDIVINTTGTITSTTFAGALTGDVTGNADTATALETTRTIGGVSFDGSANINLPGVNTSGNQDTSGNAATATALETARTIAGQSFDGSANITIASTDLSNTSDVVLLTSTQTLTNKTLTSPVISTISNTGTLTLPTSTDTLVGRDTTDTLTNKTLTSTAFSGTATNFTSTGIDDNATSTAITIDGSQKVGIGTTSPSTTLDIQPSLANSGIRVRRHNASSQYIEMSETDGSRHQILAAGDKELRILNQSTSHPTTFYTSSTERVRIDQSGNVGIGNTNPADFAGANGQNLVVGSGSGAEGMTIYSGTTSDGVLGFADGSSGTEDYRGFLIYKHNGDAFQFGTSSSERMRLNSTGLGIGTTTPNRLLTLAGTSNARLALNASSYSDFTLTSDVYGFSIYDDDATAYRLTVKNNGNVGIGTSSPASIGANITTLEITGGSTIRQGGIYLSNSDKSVKSYFYGSNAITVLATESNIPLSFLTNNTERMRIDATGNVGIGTTSTTGDGLTIYGSTNNTILTLQNPYVTSGFRFSMGESGYSHQVLRLYDNSNRAVVNFDGEMGLTSFGSVQGEVDAGEKGVSIRGSVGQMRIGQDGTGTGTVMGFYNPNGEVGKIQTTGSSIAINSGSDLILQTANTEHMRILSNGRIGINRTSVNGAAKLDISHPGSSEYGLTLDSSNTSGTQYHLDIRRGGVQAGYLVSGSATAINLANASDERLKENIQNSNSAIEDLKNIQVRQFDWVDGIDTHRDFGFVAQELINVVPEAVTQGTDTLDENGKPVQSWGVDYSHIVPRLVKVCQEQQTKIEELEARITSLETNQP